MLRNNDYPSLHPFYEDIYLSTLRSKSISNELYFIHTFFEEWAGNFLHPFGDDLLRGKKLDNSIFYCYLSTQTMTFDWLCHSLIFGAYDVVLRELRTILEGLFPAYYLDITYPKANLNKKLKNMLSLENNKLNYGYKIFKMSTIDNWEDYYSLYRDLCSYVHLSRKVAGDSIRKIALKGYGEMLDVNFDKKRFTECVIVWKRIAALSSTLAVSLLNALQIEVYETNVNAFKEK
ncbi:MAG TPA: hypothetical protein PKE38_05675 [Ignavibacteriaceae bacterium]|nr:hypothetical protein [Ignavibacteriaceae bacterium]